MRTVSHQRCSPVWRQPSFGQAIHPSGRIPHNVEKPRIRSWIWHDAILRIIEQIYITRLLAALGQAALVSWRGLNALSGSGELGCSVTKQKKRTQLDCQRRRPIIAIVDIS